MGAGPAHAFGLSWFFNGPSKRGCAVALNRNLFDPLTVVLVGTILGGIEDAERLFLRLMLVRARRDRGGVRRPPAMAHRSAAIAGAGLGDAYCNRDCSYSIRYGYSPDEPPRPSGLHGHGDEPRPVQISDDVFSSLI